MLKRGLKHSRPANPPATVLAAHACPGCRCSETGAAFFNDMMSKHAMHSGGQEEVLYAGGRLVNLQTLDGVQTLDGLVCDAATPNCCRLASAGEFCIVPWPEAAGGHKLVIDNNSGT